MLSGLLHGAEQGGVVNLQHALVGHEQFERGHAFVDDAGDFVHHGVGQVGDGDVETVIHRRFPVGLFVPVFDGLVQALALALNDEIYVAGGAAERRRFVAGVKVVGRDRAAERQFEMGMHVNAAGRDPFAGRVYHVRAVGGQVAANQDNLLAVNQQVRRISVGGGDQGAVFDQGFHGRDSL